MANVYEYVAVSDIVAEPSPEGGVVAKVDCELPRVSELVIVLDEGIGLAHLLAAVQESKKEVKSVSATQLSSSERRKIRP